MDGLLLLRIQQTDLLFGSQVVEYRELQNLGCALSVQAQDTVLPPCLGVKVHSMRENAQSFVPLRSSLFHLDEQDTTVQVDADEWSALPYLPEVTRRDRQGTSDCVD